MAILTLTSTSGSPGVTTLAVGLSLAWPRSVLLVDADPGAHQSVLAGFLAGRSANGKGLLRVAEAHRDRRPLEEVIMDQAISLTSDDSHSRAFLPGFSKPGSAGHFAGVWPDLVDALARLDDLGIDVLVDAGRLVNQGLPVPLVEHSAVTGVVLRSSLRSAMSARVYLPIMRDAGRYSSDASLGLVVVGEGDPYSSRELSNALSAPVLATIADDRTSAAHLSDGVSRSRKFESSPLAKSLHAAAATLSDRLSRAAEQIRI